MDTAVQLVEAYLHVNGYFTVTEYPVLEALRDGGTRTATDLDILAFRFPMAGNNPGGERSRMSGPLIAEPDPALGAALDVADMIVGEVKEGTAHFNPAARDPLVLQAALVRFGCCGPETVSNTVQKLLRRGKATTHKGHRVRMVAFGSSGLGNRHYQVVTMGHIVAFLRDYLRRHWTGAGRPQLSHPALAFLSLIEKSGADTWHDG